jgi:hypothetical protein
MMVSSTDWMRIGVERSPDPERRMNDNPVRQRQALGSRVTIIWLVSGIILFATHEPASFLSWQALVYFLPGTFAAALVFGLLGSSLHIAVMRTVSKLGAGSTPSQGLAMGMGYGLIAIEVLVVYLAAQWIVTRLLYPG